MITKRLNATAASRLFRLFPLGLYRVSGNSMEPALRNGDLVLGWKWVTPKVGDIVVVHTLQLPLIKRIISIDGNRVWLEGDNAGASTDSRQLGHYDQRDVLAKMIAKF